MAWRFRRFVKPTDTSSTMHPENAASAFKFVGLMGMEAASTICQENRHPHQVAADGANEAEAPSSSRAWLPKMGESGHWEKVLSLEWGS